MGKTCLTDWTFLKSNLNLFKQLNYLLFTFTTQCTKGGVRVRGGVRISRIENIPDCGWGFTLGRSYNQG